MKQKLQIKDVVQRTGLDRETLRFYEQKGLLPKSSRTEAGYREFDPDIVIRIKFIKMAQEVGFSLKEISELLALGQSSKISKADLKKIANEKIAALDQKIVLLQTMRQSLIRLSSQAIKTTATKSCPILSQIKNLEY